MPNSGRLETVDPPTDGLRVLSGLLDSRFIVGAGAGDGGGVEEPLLVYSNRKGTRLRTMRSGADGPGGGSN